MLFAQSTKARRSKFGNKATFAVDCQGNSIRLASKREAKRLAVLQLRERTGEIRYIERQVPFKFPSQHGGNIRYVGKRGRLGREITYIADFVYWERITDKPMADWRKVVEDTKGFRTDIYKLKVALMMEHHGVEVRET